MHQKHPKIARPPQRSFARTAVALVGTNCESIESIMANWLNKAAAEFRCVGITGDHGEAAWAAQGQHGSRQWMSPQGEWNEYDDRLEARTYDLALVNGNHYPAEKQIVFLDAKKAGTLERRKEQLTDIIAIIDLDGTNEVAKWLKEKQSLASAEPAVFSIDQLNEVLTNHLLPLARERTPSLKALILTGGKSSRMGSSKAELVYRNGKNEAERMTGICQALGLEVYHSVQEADSQTETPQIIDRFLGLGPAGAIASAFLHDPEAAWLVLACDLPLLEQADVARLMDARDSRKYATALQGKDQPFPEPLMAIYEPRAYQRLLQFLSLGYACPRKLLINSDIATLEVQNQDILTNANTPEDRANILQLLARK